jgi:hypothetical protein
MLVMKLAEPSAPEWVVQDRLPGRAQPLPSEIILWEAAGASIFLHAVLSRGPFEGYGLQPVHKPVRIRGALAAEVRYFLKLNCYLF